MPGLTAAMMVSGSLIRRKRPRSVADGLPIFCRFTHPDAKAAGHVDIASARDMEISRVFTGAATMKPSRGAISRQGFIERMFERLNHILP